MLCFIDGDEKTLILSGIGTLVSGSRVREPGCPTFGAVLSRLRWDIYNYGFLLPRIPSTFIFVFSRISAVQKDSISTVPDSPVA